MLAPRLTWTPGGYRRPLGDPYTVFRFPGASEGPVLITHNLLVLATILCLWWLCPGVPVPALVAPGCHPVPSVSLPAVSLSLL